MQNRPATLFMMLLFLVPLAARAQTDTSSNPLGTIVVTANRTASSIGSATAAVSRLDAGFMRANATRSVSDALRLTPGLTFVDFDGLGHDPQLMLRGFYGGGEAEYALLLLDGRPLNALETGRATWDQIPLSAIESIEIVRGGSSAMWGDAALGGVVNIRTREGAEYVRATIDGGSFGELRGTGSVRTTLGDKPLSAFINTNDSEGFREHAQRRTVGFGATLGLVQRDNTSLSITTSHDIRKFEEPGTVASNTIDISRSASASFFRFDETSERTHRLGIDYASAPGTTSHFSAQLGAEIRNSDRIRTLVLTPDFADTKNRLLDASRLTAGAKFEAGRLVLGVDASIGSLSSEYFLFTSGSGTDYESSSASRGAIDAKGEGDRAALAGYGMYSFSLGESIAINAGGRFDWLSDKFAAESPSDPAEFSATHVAFSPKFGVSWRYAPKDLSSGLTTGHLGHVYATVGRSFKAPTQDQLFDQRNIPSPFPPFAITFANNALNPQYGTNYEIGIRHGTEATEEGGPTQVSVSVYRMDLRDELDFDINTFKYQNIGGSRHTGVETAASFSIGGITVFGNYAMQSVKSRSGDNAGNYLKAVPQHIGSAGVGLQGLATALDLNLTVTTAQGMFLDDANTTKLDAWTRADLRGSFTLPGSAQVFVDVFNLFNAEFNTTGFPDPSGTDLVYYYPAASRAIRVGITREW